MWWKWPNTNTSKQIDQLKVQLNFDRMMTSFDSGILLTTQSASSRHTHAALPNNCLVINQSFPHLPIFVVYLLLSLDRWGELRACEWVGSLQHDLSICALLRLGYSIDLLPRSSGHWPTWTPWRRWIVNVHFFVLSVLANYATFSVHSRKKGHKMEITDCLQLGFYIQSCCFSSAFATIPRGHLVSVKNLRDTDPSLSVRGWCEDEKTNLKNLHA